MTFRKAVLPFLSRGKGMQNATIYFMTKSQQTIPKMYRRQENPKIFLFSLKREREREHSEKRNCWKILCPKRFLFGETWNHW
jgi:hypothetical protein